MPRRKLQRGSQEGGASLSPRPVLTLFWGPWAQPLCGIYLRVPAACPSYCGATLCFSFSRTGI